MKNKLCKLIALLLVGVMALSLLAACGSDDEDTVAETDEEEDKIQIGYSIDSLVVERWERDKDMFVAKANELGAEVNVQNASADVELQKEQVQYLIKKGVDVLVIIAADADSMKEEIAAAHERGIKVIAYDRLVKDSDADLYLSFDNEEVGTLMAESLDGKVLVGDNVIMINGSPSDNNVSMVVRGFKNVATAHKWNVIDVYFCDSWKQELAFDYVNENLDLVKTADAIMCGNDAIAGQVLMALSENRIMGDIYVTGQDADLDACQRIVEGMQYMTVYKPIDELAEIAAEYAVKMAKGEPYNVQGTINDGTYDVDYFYIEPTAVTADNMDETVIADGFHLVNEVYREQDSVGSGASADAEE